MRTNPITTGLGLVLVAVLMTSGAGAVTIPTIKAGSANNGYIVMVHMQFEGGIRDTGMGVPAIEEAAAGTEDGGEYVIYATMYSTTTGEPVVVQDLWLGLNFVSAGGLSEANVGPRVYMQPNDVPDGKAICEYETEELVPGSPIAACNVFRIAADSISSTDLLALSFYFRDARGPQVEAYNAQAHLLLHDYLANPDAFQVSLDETSDGEVPDVTVSLGGNPVLGTGPIALEEKDPRLQAADRMTQTNTLVTVSEYLDDVHDVEVAAPTY